MPAFRALPAASLVLVAVALWPWLSLAASTGAADGTSQFPRLRFLDRGGHPVPDVVVLATGAAAASTPAARMGVMDQRNKRFVPHVLTLDPGAKVVFPNSDDTRHHVYSFSPARTFELELFRANEAPPVAFPNTGIVTLGCNIHDSMKGYIFVTDVQVRAVTDSSGEARLSPAPDSWPQQLTIWHPQLGERMTLDTPPRIDSDDVWTIDLPLNWVRPQQGKGQTELEKRLKQFQGHGD